MNSQAIEGLEVLLLLKLGHDMGKEGTPPVTVFESSISLILRLHKEPSSTEVILRPMYFMSMHKILLIKRI